MKTETRTLLIISAALLVGIFTSSAFASHGGSCTADQVNTQLPEEAWSDHMSKAELVQIMEDGTDLTGLEIEQIEALLQRDDVMVFTYMIDAGTFIVIVGTNDCKVLINAALFWS